WFRRDLESSSNSLVPLEGSYGSHLLNIHRASLSDSGIYVCIASNPFGEIRRDFAIQVTSPLSLHVSPQRQEVNSGSDVVFNCSVAGHPVNEVRWLKDGKRLFPTSDRIRLVISTAVIYPSGKLINVSWSFVPPISVQLLSMPARVGFCLCILDEF
ncbi:unnamed protein product, partial [Allacma fusca]